MNADDRKKVSELTSQLEAAKAQVENIGSELSDMADAEQEKFDNMSEGLQQSETGQKIEAAAEALREAADAAESGNAAYALDALGNIEQ